MMPTIKGFGALVAESGICFGVDLANPTASPPAWLGVRHPETCGTDGHGGAAACGRRALSPERAEANQGEMP